MGRCPDRQVLEALVENSQDQLVYLDRNFDFVWVNRAYAETCRRPVEDFIGRNHFALYPHPENQAIFERVRETGVPAVWREKPFVFPDQPERGTTYWDWTLTPVKDASGRVEGFVFSLREVTDKVLARESLRQNEERYRSLFESMNEGHALHEMVFDEAGRPVDYRFLDVNPAFARLTGLDAQAVIGRTVRDVLPDLEPAWIENYGRVVRTGVSERFQSHAEALGRWYEVYAYRPAPGRFAVSFADITARKAIEEQLARAHEWAASLARFAEENPDPVLRVGADRALLYANPAARTALAELGLALGKPAPAVIADPARRAAAGAAVMRAEIRCGARVFSMNFSAMGDEVNAYGHEITDRKRAEEERREAEIRLGEANRRKDEFLGMLSHELRNPLAPIGNSLYILERVEPNSEQAVRAKTVIRRQLEHLTRLVDDLLDVTRIARGKIELRRRLLDLGALVAATVDDHRSLFVSRGLTLHLELPPETIWVDGDPTRLAQVVGNLLQNAAKFTPGGGNVTVRLRPLPHAVELAVEDDGAGMEPDLVAQIFEPFVQGERTLARTEGGLGLGLALVRGIAELHAGTVRAESAGKGTGSTFLVQLPISDGTSQSRWTPRSWQGS